MEVVFLNLYLTYNRHVGIGSDFDGVDRKCLGLEDTGMYPNLIAAVLRKSPNTTDEEIKGLLGENILRVWERAEQVRDDLKTEKPSEELWKGRKPWHFQWYI
jgi:membrane dipeptidase